MCYTTLNRTKLSISAILVVLLTSCGAPPRFSQSQCIENRRSGVLYKINEVNGDDNYVASPFIDDCLRICEWPSIQPSGYSISCMAGRPTEEIKTKTQDDYYSIGCPKTCDK